MSDLYLDKPIIRTIGLGEIIIIVAGSFGAGCLFVGYTLKPSMEQATYEAQHYKAKAMEMEDRKDTLERLILKRDFPELSR